MIAKNVDELLSSLQGSVHILDGRVAVAEGGAVRRQAERLAFNAVFGEGLVRDTARWLLWEIGQEMGVFPASIHELYMSVGRGEVAPTFTVPAINVRGMNFETSRAIFRAANKLDVGALLLEIARSEIGYTDQRPAEYVASVLAAAIAEGFQGPLFIQGDHFQVSAKGFAADPEKEVGAVRDLMGEAIEAGFYNIDIDTSTLVDLSHDALDAQQRNNYTVSAALTEFARSIQPEGITVSLGGEIGEVGEKNSTVPELRAYMDGYRKALPAGVEGISKISVQTGTSHGGVVLPDGTLAQVSVDFDTLRELSKVAREEYGLGGAVQHGASTLPPEAFDRFPAIGTLEIHLATGFQNIMFEHAPEELVRKADEYCLTNLGKEWKEGKTEQQFLYSTRKKSLGPLKAEWWNLDREAKDRIGSALQEQFEFLFEKLNVRDTRQVVFDVTSMPKRRRPRPQQAAAESELEIASDLAD